MRDRVTQKKFVLHANCDTVQQAKRYYDYQRFLRAPCLFVHFDLPLRNGHTLTETELESRLRQMTDVRLRLLISDFPNDNRPFALRGHVTSFL